MQSLLQTCPSGIQTAVSDLGSLQHASFVPRTRRCSRCNVSGVMGLKPLGRTGGPDSSSMNESLHPARGPSVSGCSSFRGRLPGLGVVSTCSA